MKKLIYGILMAVMACGIISCKNEYDSLDDGNYRIHGLKDKHVMKTVRMSFGGDYITESEEPLLRADDGDLYTAINVFRTEKSKDDAVEEKYAYGVFKGKDGISIDVVTGYTYRFEATILIERDDKVHLVENRYQQPFRLHDGSSINFDNASDLDSKYTDSFLYTYELDSKDRRFLFELNSGKAMVDTKGDYSPRNADLGYPRVKRYYGTYSSFDPGLEDNVEIEMGYKSFGLRFELENLPGGYLSVKDISKDSSNRTKDTRDCLVFTKDLKLSTEDTNNIWEGLFSMNNLLAESEKFTLQFIWHKGGDVTEDFETEVTVRPKIKKILKLNIAGTPNYGTKGNIILTLEDEQLTEEQEQISHDFDND
ncbi:MAG: hypothetical protein K2L11_03110 [Muribaculaceae bacterium]|nr:hypothetical protein [Muribaculaceae bacterium]